MKEYKSSEGERSFAETKVRVEQNSDFEIAIDLRTEADGKEYGFFLDYIYEGSTRKQTLSIISRDVDCEVKLIHHNIEGWNGKDNQDAKKEFEGKLSQGLDIEWKKAALLIQDVIQVFTLEKARTGKRENQEKLKMSLSKREFVKL